MSLDELRDTLQKLRRVTDSFFINGVGDYLYLDNHQQYSDVLAEFYRRGDVGMSVTTNCGFVVPPRITAGVIICSFNAVTREAFDKHIGLDIGFDGVVENIRYMAKEHGVVEIHSLAHAGNLSPEADLLRLFGDLNVRIRVSYKVENQMRSSVSAPRVPCTYLENKLCVYPGGWIRQCNHDFREEELIGHVDELDETIAELKRRHGRQHAGFYTDGICANCNFNVASGFAGEVKYIK